MGYVFGQALDRNDSSSITGIVGEGLASSLLKHYFRSQDYEVSIFGKPIELVGKKWLDRWIKVSNKDKILYYQVEIKNWCSHSKGGKKIPLKVESSVLAKYAYNRFRGEWDIVEKKFWTDVVGKVLKEMKVDKFPEKSPKIQPLVCFWFPINNDTKNLSPFFQLDCKSNEETNFEFVNIFSMSLYLRELLSKGIEELIIEDSVIENRLRKLNDLFEIC